MTTHSHTPAPSDIEAIHTEVETWMTRASHRYTAGRRVLVEVLAGVDRPLTLPEILEQRSTLAQSSAYRNLVVLESCGVVRRISVGGDHTHYELSEPLMGHHHHLICIDCGTIEDIHLSDELEHQVDSTLAAAAKQAGFSPLHHSLDLYGRCGTCSAKSTDAPTP